VIAAAAAYLTGPNIIGFVIIGVVVLFIMTGLVYGLALYGVFTAAIYAHATGSGLKPGSPRRNPDKAPAPKKRVRSNPQRRPQPS
jgi:hypothetical protein